MSIYLGIDTSNYTTSLAVADESGVVYNLKLPLPVKEGALGLRQSDALFAHTVGLPQIFEQLRAQLGTEDLAGQIAAVGYSATPRDCEGSYMPCFLAGTAVARALGAVLNVPVYPFSHQAGHVAAAAYSANRLDLLETEFLAFHVSGGTTDLLHVNKMQITEIGRSSDLHAGQAVDRIGRLLGLSFPCGAALERLSEAEPLPPCRVSVRGTECSLSGLENQAKKLQEQGATPAYVAAYTLSYLAKTIDQMSQAARERYPDLPILYAGGVMSNARIQAVLAKRADTHFAAPALSADNAAGIALLCKRKANF